MTTITFSLGSKISVDLSPPLGDEKMPDWVAKKLSESVQWAVNKLQAALIREKERNDEAAAKLTIAKFSEEVRDAVIAAGYGCVEVKVGKGKTDASRKASVAVIKGDEPSSLSGSSSFYVPAASIISKRFLPVWLVEKKLVEVAERAEYRSGQYKRVLAAPRVWPGEADYLAMCEEKILPAWREAVEKYQAELVTINEQIEKNARESREKSERFFAERAIQKEKSAKANANRLKRRAALETHKNVAVEWLVSERRDGQYVKVPRRLENVTVQISGSRAYVIEVGGKEHIKPLASLKIFAQPNSAE